MKTRIILSTTERKVHPWLSFMMSLFLPGLGEIYAGMPLSGIIFSLSRVITILSVPFYSFINNSESMSEEIFTAIVLSVLITLVSALYSFFKSRGMKSIQSWYNSILVYSIFSCVYIFLTVLATAFFLSFFEIRRTAEAVPPLFRKGDIIAIKKISISGYSRGDIVVAKTDSGLKFLRVIGIPGERIEYRKGRFLSEGSELPLSIFNDDELRKIYLTDYDVISEQNGRTRYAVKSNPAINIPETTLSEKEFYLAPDVRNTPELFLKIQNSGIRGRVEGIILSREEGILPGSISLPSDNFISAKK